jgi:hypothetical protein
VIFGKFANSLAGSGTSVVLPDVDTKYDFEAAPADLGHGAFVPLTLPPRSSASLSRLLLDPVAALGDRDDPN